MQTSKSRNGSSEVPQKPSPTTPIPSRAKKTGVVESESATSKSTPTKTLIDRSPKSTERRSPRSPIIERKRLSKVTELESQLTQLQEDLKQTKDQLGTSESWRRLAQQKAEEAEKQLSAMIVKLEDSQHQYMEFSAAEEARLQELRQISQERDRAWQSELEVTQKQHSMDSAALVNAMNEIHRLRKQLEVAVKSEAAHSELHALKQEMAEALSIVEELRDELRNSEKAEAEAHAIVRGTRQELEMAKANIETLRLDGLKLIESVNSKALKLEESKARVALLEETVKKLEESKARAALLEETVKKLEESKARVTMVSHGSMESEIEQLISALEAAEIKCQEEQIQSTIQIRSAYELVERVRIDSSAREAELESALKNAKSEIFVLRASLMDKETELQSISDMNKEIMVEVEKSQVIQTKFELEALKANLLDKEMELQSVSEENELLKAEMEKRETESCKSHERAITEIELAIASKHDALLEALKLNLLDKEMELQSIFEENKLLKAELGKREEDRKSYERVVAEVELARAAENDALTKLGCVTEEARRVTRVAEQLEAAQVVNSEMEAELRRLRVQSDQWRKAAEAAAAAMSPGNNGRFVERTSSLNIGYHHESVGGKLMSSPFSDDLDDDSPKKKNSNVMRKISGLWKKSPK